MSIPSYDQFIEPILRFLAAHPEGARARDAMEAAADALGLTEADRLAMLPSGMQAVYRNRAGWAHDRLKRAGLSSSPRRGFWRITPEGLALAQHAQPLPPEEIERIAIASVDVRLRTGAEGSAKEGDHLAPPQTPALASPQDRLDGALQELRSAVTAELP